MARPKDGSSFWEDIYKVASEEFADMSKWLIENEAPRPFGSEEVSDEEQALAYGLMRHDSDQLADFYIEQGANLGSAAKHMAKMRKHLGL